MTFVYASQSVDGIVTGNPRRRHTELGVWSGSHENGVILGFFNSVGDARRAFIRVKSLYGGERVRNVIVDWDQGAKPRSFRRNVVGCLRSHGEQSGPAHPTPKATLATFAGLWGGHDRGLRISAGGVGDEFANASCCIRDYVTRYRILAVHGTLTDATADVRVISYRRFPTGHGRGIAVKSRVGERGKLRLKNGILTNELTNDYFCSNPAWGATEACGA